MSESLNVVAAVVGLVAVIVPILAGIRTRNPAKRKYWEREAQDRLGAGKWPKDERLRKRAELAVAYLDADEAIRRSGLPGPAASWLTGSICYLATVLFGSTAARIMGRQEHLEKQLAKAASSPKADELATKLAEVGSPTLWIILMFVALAATILAYLDAATIPQARNELQRVLVSLMAIPGGAEALEARPETFVKGWSGRKRKRRIKRSTKIMKDIGRRYEVWAQALFQECHGPSTKVLIQISNSKIGENSS